MNSDNSNSFDIISGFTPFPFPNGLNLFGQLVIGPPGSGKTTYCSAMYDFLTNLGRKVAIINLDPANEHLPYPCSIDLGDLIKLDEVMDYLGLGPNGGLIYCMEYLHSNRDWLAHRIAQLKCENPKIYLIFDLPGQVELYTHDPCMHQLISYFIRNPNMKANANQSNLSSLPCSSNQNVNLNEPPDGLDLHLTSVHLVDSHYCSDPGKFISCVLTSLSAMLQLSLPHVNILSKADLIEQFGELDFNLDFFTEILDLNYLIDRMQIENDPFYQRYAKLNKVLVDLIQDHSLVQFLLLDIQDMNHLKRVMSYVDRANGYVFGPNEQHHLHTLMHSASGVELTPDWIGMTQEKYMSKSNNESNVDLLS